jgi:hypothetical protein
MLEKVSCGAAGRREPTGLHALFDVLGEGESGVAIDGDVVIIVYGDEVAQLQVTLLAQWKHHQCSGPS